MKVKELTGILAMTASIATGAFAADYQMDTFKTKSGKEVVISAIKHALAASRRPFGDGYARPQGQVCSALPERRKTALYNQIEICYNTHQTQERPCQQMLCNECFTG